MRNFIHLIICFMVILIATNTMGCLKGTHPQTADKSDLKQILSQLKGKFVWREDLGKYDFSDKLEVEKALSTRSSEKSVGILVDCLDDWSASQSKIDNAPVPLGIICYEALQQLVYYEPMTSNGDIADNWPGYVSPTASLQEMRNAKQAWKKVIESKSYIFQ